MRLAFKKRQEPDYGSQEPDYRRLSLFGSKSQKDSIPDGWHRLCPGGQEAGAASGKGRQKGQPAQKILPNDGLAAAEKQSRKGARSKRRKASVLREPGGGGCSPQIVKSLSLGSSQSSSYECSSMLSGEPDEADSLATPVPIESVSSDLSAESVVSHLDKLTAESLSGGEPRKGQKAAGGKRHVSVRVDTAAPAATPVQQSSSSSTSSPSATPTVRSPAQPAKKDLAPRTPAR